MEKKVTWNEVEALYRKKPARFKAMQYNKNDESLPPDTFFTLSADGTQQVLGIRFTDGRTYTVEDGDWLVLDLTTGNVVVVNDCIFSMVFEQS